MKLIISLDAISVIAIALAIFATTMKFTKRLLLKHNRTLTMVLLLNFFVYNLMLLMEWSRINPAMEELEDIVGALLPMSWAFVLNGILQSVSKHSLGESEQKFKAVFNQTFQFVGLLDLDGILMEVNETALNAIASKKEEVVGKLFWETKWWNYSDKVKLKLRDAIEGAAKGELIRFEVENQMADGSRINVDFSIKPITDETGKIFMLISEGRDITELKNTQNQKEKAENQLRQSQKMDAIGTLAGGIAHDFNNILSGIYGFAELALMECVNNIQAKEYIDQLLNLCERAKSLVKQILTFSRQSDTKREYLDPMDLLNREVKMVRHLIPSNIEIKTDINPISGLVYVNPVQFSQIFLNIVTNSQHAMEAKGGRLEIVMREISFQEDDLKYKPGVKEGSFVQISFSDTGIGIPKNVVNRVMEPYFTTKESGKGTGMGLSIVYGIVQSYGGFMSIYSEEKKGTTVNVFLPVDEDESEKLAVEKKESVVGDNLSILFVDDEVAIRASSKAILESKGHKVTIADNGKMAFELFKNGPDNFDLIITDQTMPKMTGFEMAQEILKINPEMPIILCTGYSSIVSKSHALEAGIREYAVKPLTSAHLSELITKVMKAKP